MCRPWRHTTRDKERRIYLDGEVVPVSIRLLNFGTVIKGVPAVRGRGKMSGVEGTIEGTFGFRSKRAGTRSCRDDLDTRGRGCRCGTPSFFLTIITSSTSKKG